MLWLLYALLAAIFTTIFALLARIISIESENPRAYSVTYGIASALFSIVLFTLEPFSLRAVPASIIVLTVLATICYGISDRLLFYVSRSIEVSLLSIIERLTPVVTFVASLLFLGETFSLKKLLAVLLIVGGNILVVYKNSVIKFDRWFVFAFVAALCLGVALTIDKRASIAYALPVYSVINFFAPAMYNLFIPPLPFKVIADEFKRVTWKVPLLAAMGVLAYYCTLSAFRLTEASKVILVGSSSTILVVLAGAIFLKERSHLSRKMIASTCVCLGIVLLSS